MSFLYDIVSDVVIDMDAGITSDPVDADPTVNVGGACACACGFGGSCAGVGDSCGSSGVICGTIDDAC